MYLYTLKTWLIANLLHPVILFVYFDEAESIEPGMTGLALQLVMYSFLFSLPSLLLGMGAIHIVFKLPFSATGKYLSWLMATLVIVVINFGLLFTVFFRVSWRIDELEIMVPALLAVSLTVLIRTTWFFQLVIQLKNKENENTLV